MAVLRALGEAQALPLGMHPGFRNALFLRAQPWLHDNHDPACQVEYTVQHFLLCMRVPSAWITREFFEEKLIELPVEANAETCPVERRCHRRAEPTSILIIRCTANTLPPDCRKCRNRRSRCASTWKQLQLAASCRRLLTSG